MRRRLGSLSLLTLFWAATLPGDSAAEPPRETLIARSTQQADDREHPRAHLVPVVVPRAFHGGARVCGHYENDVFNATQMGQARLDVGLWRGGTRIARVGFRRRSVGYDNQIHFGCREVPRLRAGDTLLFDFRFFDMPRLAPRPFSHGGVVNTAMVVTATVEPRLPGEASTIELLSVSPPFGSKIPAGGRIEVRIGFTCNQPLGCNAVAGFEHNGSSREEVRWVRPGSHSRRMILKCRRDNRVELVKSGLVLAIERSYGSTLDATVVDGAFTCAARR